MRAVSSHIYSANLTAEDSDLLEPISQRPSLGWMEKDGGPLIWGGVLALLQMPLSNSGTEAQHDGGGDLLLTGLSSLHPYSAIDFATLIT